MPSISQNRKKWGSKKYWEKNDNGDKWSQNWGSVNLQWYHTLLPRIYNFIPTDNILEIAPGYGRWTNFLKDMCNHIAIVDLSEICIDFCKSRFSDIEKVKYFVNDGCLLNMVEDNTVDFVFSFDSLVHANSDVLSSYVSEISKKLNANGVAFIHHSNLGNYKDREGPNNWRDASMTAEKMREYIDTFGMFCFSQEMINWNSGEDLIDCLSIFGKEKKETKILKNPFFMNEAENCLRMSGVYE
jgi:SAM-dependent methyltransferase